MPAPADGAWDVNTDSPDHIGISYDAPDPMPSHPPVTSVWVRKRITGAPDWDAPFLWEDFNPAGDAADEVFNAVAGTSYDVEIAWGTTTQVLSPWSHTLVVVAT